MRSGPCLHHAGQAQTLSPLHDFRAQRSDPRPLPVHTTRSDLHGNRFRHFVRFPRAFVLRAALTHAREVDTLKTTEACSVAVLQSPKVQKLTPSKGSEEESFLEFSSSVWWRLAILGVPWL